MAIEFNKTGPLRYATLRKINEVTFWDKTFPPKIDPEPDDEPHVIKQTDRIDLLSSRTYSGNEALGWVILERNNMRLWPNDFVPGKVIFLPTMDSLRRRKIVS